MDKGALAPSPFFEPLLPFRRREFIDVNKRDSTDAACATETVAQKSNNATVARRRNSFAAIFYPRSSIFD